MYPSQLSSLLPLHYRHGFHSRLENLNRLLRYSLGLCSQTWTSDVQVWFAQSRNCTCMSPCRSDYIFFRLRGVWRVVSEGFAFLRSSLLIVCTNRFSLPFGEYCWILRYSSIWPDCLQRFLPAVPLSYIFLFLDIGRMGAAFEDSAPPKLPATHGPLLDPNRVRHCTQQEWYFILRLHISRNRCFKVSHLCYACSTQCQYEAVVKLLGSFRLTTGIRHLHRKCIFTERVLETVPQSLHHSCTSELTRQGITLFDSF